jgi:hypothetical protein
MNKCSIAIFAFLLTGCESQLFFEASISVDTSSGVPVFTFDANQPIDTFGMACTEVGSGEHLFAWEVTGSDIPSPITYGEVPQNSSESIAPIELTGSLVCEASIWHTKENGQQLGTFPATFETADLDKVDSDV